MKTLSEYIQDAEINKTAIGHFNISNIEGLWAIFGAAKELKVPVIIGVSEGERDFVGVHQAVALVKSIREEFNYPIFLNADHTYSVERVKEAIDAGFDSVIFDGAKLPLEENIKLAKECVDYARAHAEKTGHDVLVEGELGYIGQSSKVLDAIPEGVDLSESSLTKIEEAERFVKETGVDMLAPAVGNFHGMLRGGVDPRLNIERIKAIREATGVPLVLHGGSGNSSEDFSMAIDVGIAIVHVNTEIRVAYRDALKLSLQENPDEVAPYKIMKSSVSAMKKVVDGKLKVFNKLA
jgi:fructose-bisphosphate aldolase class II